MEQNNLSEVSLSTELCATARSTSSSSINPCLKLLCNKSHVFQDGSYVTHVFIAQILLRTSVNCFTFEMISGGEDIIFYFSEDTILAFSPRSWGQTSSDLPRYSPQITLVISSLSQGPSRPPTFPWGGQ